MQTHGEQGESKETAPMKPTGAALLRAGSAALVHGFGVSARDLGKLHVSGKHDECIAQLEMLGGVRGLVDKLSSNSRTGIPADTDDIAHRKEGYGENVMPEPPFAGFWSLFLDSFKDPILLILVGAAVVSFAVGLSENLSHGWIDGAAIAFAILLVAFVSAGNNYNKELQFRALRNDANDMVRIRVLRNGDNAFVPVKDIVVGDIVHLETGDKIVADGVFISGSSVKTEEGAITGESDNVSKDAIRDPFMISGTSMAAGTCSMVVSAVGVRSMQGRIMADTAMESKDTPLQEKLTALAEKIGYFGFGSAIATFIAMIISWFADNDALVNEYPSFKNWIIHAFITSVTIIVVAIPEGLPLAVTISLAYSTRKMFKDNNLIRVLAACETMGNATDICSDKTGTLTENRMTVTKAWLGGDILEFPSSDKAPSPDRSANLAKIRDAEIANMIRDHLALNSTVVVTWESSGKAVVNGSKTEGAGVLLVESMGYRYLTIRGSGASQNVASEEAPAKALVRDNSNLDQVTAVGDELRGKVSRDVPKLASHRDLDGGDLAEGSVHIVRQYPFTAERKMMSTVVSLDPSNPINGPVRVYVSGASEIVLRRSRMFLWPTASPGRSDPSTARVVALTPQRMEYLEQEVIHTFASQSLRTIGLAYRDFASREELPASWMANPDEWAAGSKTIEEGLTFYGVIGIKDPLRPDVKEAVEQCHRAGIIVRMVTGDNSTTAAAIAKECGILTSPADLVVEGPVFRSMTPKEVDAILPNLKVMARSSPRDKNMLVRRLNGALPESKEQWEKEHIDQEFIWDTDCALYNDTDFIVVPPKPAASSTAAAGGEDVHHAKGFAGLNEVKASTADRSGMKIQDVALPGYLSEWEASRKNGKDIRKPIVGVTGDGTNDAPALKAADVGLSMGLGGTQVAKDASDIVILDDRFSSIVKAVMWGRSVYDNIRKFLQFQLTVNVVAVLLVFISAVSQRNPPLSPVQLLWVNLIMDTMGALALGTEEPTMALLDRRPYRLTASILNRVMMRNVLCQSAFQLAITLWMVYNGAEVFGIDRDYVCSNGFGCAKDNSQDELNYADKSVNEYLNTFIFNTFVIMQVYNEFNARSIGHKLNVWGGLHKNPIFMGIILITIGAQIFIVEIGGRFTSTTGLTLTHWGWSFLLAAGTIPVGVLMRFIPVEENPASFADYYGVDTTAHRRTSEAGGSLEMRIPTSPVTLAGSQKIHARDEAGPNAV